jgi:RNA polymerase sigma factor (sigma-70 family)
VSERIIRQAARSLLPKLVSPLEPDDLYQVARIALWQAGDVPESHQYTIARGAMLDEIRRARWAGRGTDNRYADGAPWEMTSYSGWTEVPEGSTDCHAASLVAVRQCIASMHSLPERERQILACLALGMDQQEVAARIGLSPQRVGQLIAALRVLLARFL